VAFLLPSNPVTKTIFRGPYSTHRVPKTHASLFLNNAPSAVCHRQPGAFWRYSTLVYIGDGPIGGAGTSVFGFPFNVIGEWLTASATKTLVKHLRSWDKKGVTVWTIHLSWERHRWQCLLLWWPTLLEPLHIGFPVFVSFPVLFHRLNSFPMLYFPM
jgi:hypothetical protein